MSVGLGRTQSRGFHVLYRVHDSNSSGSALGPVSLDHHRRLFEPLVRGVEQLREECTFAPSELVALKRRLHRECFWHLGYSVYKAIRESAF